MARPGAPSADRASAVELIGRIETDLATLRALLAAGDGQDAAPPPPPSEWLSPCQLAARLNVGEAQVRRLCRRGSNLGLPGIERRGGRWVATVDALAAMRV